MGAKLNLKIFKQSAKGSDPMGIQGLFKFQIIEWFGESFKSCVKKSG
jgi:hypothetical protein